MMMTRALRFTTLAAALMVCAVLSGVRAQAPTEDAVKQRQQELEAARAAQKKAAEREAALKSEIAVIAKDRAKLGQQLIESAKRVSDVEAQVAATQARIKPLDERETAIRASLDARRAVTGEVLAALQRAGRRSPPALLVQPEDALRSLRSAMLLGAVVPNMRAEAEKLIADLSELVRVRKNIADERDRLAQERDKLAADQQRVALLVEERQKQQSQTEQDMAREREQAAELAQQALNLQDLIAKMEADIKSAAAAAAKAAALADLKAVPPAAAAKPDLGAFKNTARLAPAIAFASARKLLPLPVSGLKIHEFGASDGIGGTHKGLSVATRAGAQVTTPCDGWVVYAGPFRSYGQLLILNAGGGYHVLLAGMDRISVNIGQFVLTGEPVATMGSGSQVAAILATSGSQPVLYIEFRKDGTPIDPSPWWASKEGEKVRG